MRRTPRALFDDDPFLMLKPCGIAESHALGLNAPSSATISNRKCPCKTVKEEDEMRLDAVTQQIKVYRAMLPVILKPDVHGQHCGNTRIVARVLHGVL